MPRFFRLEDAQRLLPELEPVVRNITSLKKSFEEVDLELRAYSERITLLGGTFVPREELALKRRNRDLLASSLKKSIDTVHQHGCVLKDLGLGLVDFPTLFRGEEVYLCWKLGEPAIEFWHGMTEGFRGRKPIDKDFLENHRGE
ncbi:MAG TPA: DUF2203 domain-containing protein [Bryobacteraceae bacterium]|nr:DUF2203 domain-containing protein [Bryobacteraceae bacterium]HOL71631.1 DUF2203 domain-containing protein [Bryobacteraceae bacterium]HOQ45816.1 DUF2203 domain-containing protein [Bryobacteraceae bacterium]HPQ14738.1 DUF2203 domain-containing protein [Bryobacteraceae bacterium]HPU70975.1 DUF2203 domain-containing protein [Bryobacteraceae bacterium]